MKIILFCTFFFFYYTNLFTQVVEGDIVVENQITPYVKDCNIADNQINTENDFDLTPELLEKMEAIYATVESAQSNIEIISDLTVGIDGLLRVAMDFTWNGISYPLEEGVFDKLHKSSIFLRKINKIVNTPSEFIKKKLPYLKWVTKLTDTVSKTIERTHPTIAWMQGYYTIFENIFKSQGIEVKLNPTAALYEVLWGELTTRGYLEKMDKILKKVEDLNTQLLNTKKIILDIPEIDDHRFNDEITEAELKANTFYNAIMQVAPLDAQIQFAKNLRAYKYFIYLNQYQACLDQRILHIDHVLKIKSDMATITKKTYDEITAEAKSKLLNSSKPYSVLAFLEIFHKDQSLIEDYARMKDPFSQLKKTITQHDKNKILSFYPILEKKRNELKVYMVNNKISFG